MKLTVDNISVEDAKRMIDALYGSVVWESTTDDGNRTVRYSYPNQKIIAKIEEAEGLPRT